MYLFTVMIHWQVRCLSCEPNNQLHDIVSYNAFTTSETEDEIVHVKLV